MNEKYLKYLSLTLILIFSLKSNLKAQDSSVLAKGEWYKFSVSERGVYKIDASWLEDAGIDPSTIDPRKLSIYGQSEGMLPQKISDPRPTDLLENAIYVKGEEDGKFDADDYILFFANNQNKVIVETSGFISTETNLYSNQAFYFLHLKEDAGARIQDQKEIIGDFPKVSTYTAHYTYEPEETNLLRSGREWYGKEIKDKETQINIPLSDLNSQGQINVKFNFMAKRFVEESNNVTIDKSLGGLELARIDKPISPRPLYTNQVIACNDLETIKAKDLGAKLNSLNFKFKVKGIGHLDKISVNADANLILRDKAKVFNSKNAVAEISTFRLEEVNQKIRVWDISQLSTPKSLPYNVTNQSLEFSDSTNTFKEYIAFSDQQALTPKFNGKIANQNLHADLSPDYVIISHKNFLSEANRLAEFRRKRDGFTVKVVDIEEIYPEFSSGMQDPTAIRDYFRYLYKNGKLKYALMFGKASYDFRNIIGYANMFVPTYQSRNSIHSVRSYASDDYFGFLDDQDGEWVENEAGDAKLNIGIGRFPSSNLIQAEIAVEKVINYHKKSKNNLGLWKSKVLLVADDGDKSDVDHIQHAEEVAQVLRNESNFYTIKKVYLDAYDQVLENSHYKVPAVVSAINENINNGILIFNYNGHGGETSLSDEGIVTRKIIADDWDNKFKLPLFVTATCQIGKHDNPISFSGAEQIIFRKNGGAIAMVTTARFVYAYSNKLLNLSVMKHILSDTHVNDRLGDAFKKIKNEDSAQKGENNRNFILFGDPALRIGGADFNVKIEEINKLDPNSDHLSLSALETVNLKGTIEAENGMINTSFNGEVIVQLIDKPIERITQGHFDRAPSTFKVLDNVVFRGKATVKDGKFSISFIIPKNINYKTGEAKLTFYAVNNELNSDALGYTKVKLGGERNRLYEGHRGSKNLTLF